MNRNPTEPDPVVIAANEAQAKQLARERVRREGRFEALKQRQRRTPAGESVTTITTPGIDITIVASEHFAGDDNDENESWI